MDEVKESLPLLDENGTVVREGWARYPYWQYNASGNLRKLRCIGFDEYSITDPENSITITAVHASLIYENIYAITYIDYKNGKSSAAASEKLGRTALKPPLSERYFSYFDSSLVMSFVRKNEDSHILLTSPSEPPEIKLIVQMERNDGNECIASAISPEKNSKGFVYTIREGALRVKGKLFYSDRRLEIRNAIGTHTEFRTDRREKGTVYSVSINALSEGRAISIFTNASSDAMNAVYSSGRIRKLGHCTLIEEGKGWRLYDQDDTIDMKMDNDTAFMIPQYKGINKVERKCIAGIFSGIVRLPDGTECSIDTGYGQIKEINWKEV